MTVLFTVWGYDVTIIEFASVILAFLAIALGIRGTRWTWPFYFLSSLLYGWLFVEFNLFASAAMQLIFMTAAIWGWFAWGRDGVRRPGRLAPAWRLLSISALAMASSDASRMARSGRLSGRVAATTNPSVR
jgi:nicotinamide mononucleotide transporter